MTPEAPPWLDSTQLTMWSHPLHDQWVMLAEKLEWLTQAYGEAGAVEMLFMAACCHALDRVACDGMPEELSEALAMRVE